MRVETMVRVMILGFCAGVGYLAAQELWWWALGLVGFCHG